MAALFILAVHLVNQLLMKSLTCKNCIVQVRHSAYESRRSTGSSETDDQPPRYVLILPPQNASSFEEVLSEVTWPNRHIQRYIDH